MNILLQILLAGSVIINTTPSKITYSKPIPVIELTDEEFVKSKLKDKPILIEIARCESGFKQFDDKGEVLRGIINNKDVGLFQINEYYHGKRAKELGIDLFTREGNLAFAKLLYREQGVQPWSWSNPCHKGLDK